MTRTERAAWVVVDLGAMDLRLFDGGEGGTAAAPAAGNGERSVPAGAPALKSRKPGEYDNVVFGRQPNAQGIVTNAAETPSDAGRESESGVQTTSSTMEERKAQYRAFKEGDFKDLFDADVQRIINSRFRETKQLQTQVEGYQPIIDLLAERLQSDARDPKALLKALKDDELYLERAADEAGLTIAAFKERENLVLENKQLLEAQRRREGEEAVQRDVARWLEEEKAMKGRYPQFDLRTEMQNPEFINLARLTSAEHAYKVIHMDELLNDAMTTTAAATEQKVAANVRARGARPAEAGNSAQGGMVVKNDVSKLTKAERAEIARRAMRGETISF